MSYTNTDYQYDAEYMAYLREQEIRNQDCMLQIEEENRMIAVYQSEEYQEMYEECLSL